MHYGMFQSNPAAAKTHVKVSGETLYKLDISWPRQPEVFTGQVFGVAVNHLAGLVYVAQVS